jgi:hypothetical protein
MKRRRQQHQEWERGIGRVRERVGLFSGLQANNSDQIYT